MLKGGGCENVGAQYSLPNAKLKADRDLEGVQRCILDAVQQAQGKGCAPGIIGACFGGDRGSGFARVEAAAPAPRSTTATRCPELDRHGAGDPRARPTSSASARWGSAARPPCSA